MGDWSATRTENRYGCFLPDLTGLATGPSAASLPGRVYQSPEEKGKAEWDAARIMPFDRPFAERLSERND